MKLINQIRISQKSSKIQDDIASGFYLTECKNTFKSGRYYENNCLTSKVYIYYYLLCTIVDKYLLYIFYRCPEYVGNYVICLTGYNGSCLR